MHHEESAEKPHYNIATTPPPPPPRGDGVQVSCFTQAVLFRNSGILLKFSILKRIWRRLVNFVVVYTNHQLHFIQLPG